MADIWEKIYSISDAFLNGDLYSLRKLSDFFLLEGAVSKSKQYVELSAIIHSLSKILEKEYYRKNKAEWNNFVKIISRIPEYNDLDQLINDLKTAIERLDKKSGRYYEHIFHRSLVRKATTLYAWGLSLGMASKLSGVSEYEILKQMGATKIADEEPLSIPEEKRLKIAEAVLE